MRLKRIDLQAVGLYTGIRGKGIVILDIDKDHAALKRKWSETLVGAPKITSTKKMQQSISLRSRS